MVVRRPNLEQEALEAVLARLTSVITDQGGEITHIDQWGKRRLAYEIDGHIEGFYVVIKFQGDPGITTELERIMRITDSVMRFLVIRDEFPSAIPQTATSGDGEPEAAPAGATSDTGAEAESTDAAPASATSDAAPEADSTAAGEDAGSAETASEADADAGEAKAASTADASDSADASEESERQQQD